MLTESVSHRSKGHAFGVYGDMYPFNTSQATWPITSGIYALSIGPRHYVGMAAGIDGFKARWGHHRVELRADSHDNRYLQSSYNKYGSYDAKFIVLEEIASGEANYFRERENHWMRALDTINPQNGYNVYGYAESGSSALRHSDETRVLMAKKATGRKLSEETKLKISKSWETRIVSDETKRKMSMSMQGKKHTPAAIAKMRRSQKGRIITKEHRRKISESYRKTISSSSYIHPHSKTYQCVDPSGKTITITNMSRYCRERGLSSTHMFQMCRGDRQRCHGHKSLVYVRKRYLNKRYDFMAPDGSIKECYIISAFAKEHGLTKVYVHRLARGHISTRKGWKLIKDYSK